jgi:hypothetical protein
MSAVNMQVHPLRQRVSQESVVVVVTGLDDDQFVIGYAVDEPVLVINAPRPKAGQVGAQLLRFAGPLERIARGFLDQPKARRSIFLSAKAQ